MLTSSRTTFVEAAPFLGWLCTVGAVGLAWVVYGLVHRQELGR